MPIEEKDLVLPRTISVELVRGDNEALELSSMQRTETRRFEVNIYSTLRGDMSDVVEEFYSGLHGSSDLYDFPSGFDNPTVIGRMAFENFEVRYNKPFSFNSRMVYSASIQFDAIADRSS